jgi:hypothetical protein
MARTQYAVPAAGLQGAGAMGLIYCGGGIGRGRCGKRAPSPLGWDAAGGLSLRGPVLC